MVIRQRVEDFQLGIESYRTQLNLTKPRWDATGFEFKHDFTVIDSLRAITFRDKYGVQMIMQFNEIHKFSGDTLQQIDEALDYRVKEFKDKRGRLQTAEDNQMITSSRQSSYKDGKVRYSIPRSCQSRRDLPRDNPLVSVEVLKYDYKRSKSENKGKVPTEMELGLELTQQGSSHEVLVSTEGVEELKGI
ncbi:hypothetical protein Tco_0886587, partial [Tanacetum coccineum]